LKSILNNVSERVLNRHWNGDTFVICAVVPVLHAALWLAPDQFQVVDTQELKSEWENKFVVATQDLITYPSTKMYRGPSNPDYHRAPVPPSGFGHPAASFRPPPFCPPFGVPPGPQYCAPQPGPPPGRPYGTGNENYNRESFYEVLSAFLSCNSVSRFT